MHVPEFQASHQGQVSMKDCCIDWQTFNAGRENIKRPCQPPLFDESTHISSHDEYAGEQTHSGPS